MKKTKKKKKTTQIVKAVRRLPLKDRLDEIDNEVKEKTFDNFYGSRLRILIGKWEKGEAISEQFRGVECSPTYRQLERETGRRNTSLKTWHELYIKYPDRNDYLPIAEEEAQSWTNKVFANAKVTPELEEPETPETPELPEGKFNVIYADPPWKYADTCEAGAIQGKGADKHYPVMSIQELCDLSISDVVCDNAVLFLWVTSPFLSACWPIIEAWGFEYKSSFVWNKVRHNMGHYNSVRHEFLLICIKGSFMPQDKKLNNSVQTIKRSLRHSEKPEEFRKMIETMYPKSKKLELFGRKKVTGWKVWGNEVDNELD